MHLLLLLLLPQLLPLLPPPSLLLLRSYLLGCYSLQGLLCPGQHL
jgi:hypothetical protein